MKVGVCRLPPVALESLGTAVGHQWKHTCSRRKGTCVITSPVTAKSDGVQSGVMMCVAGRDRTALFAVVNLIIGSLAGRNAV